jgi:Tol biopolymer transport system component
MHLLDNAEAPIAHTLQSMVNDLVHEGDLDGLKEIGFHSIPTAWKQLNIDFGDNPQGVTE